MQYRTIEMKIENLISDLNLGKINLVPAFQRGHVWKLADRKKLLSNIVLGRPFPSIFLYKDPSGSRYTYNILDGKQRLESIILFVGPGTEDLGISNWSDYFDSPNEKKQVSFSIDLPNGKRKFAKLDQKTIRDLREYSIPTIEITLHDETEVDEIIDLFVDINQRGEEVKRFQIVKAMGEQNQLLQCVFDLVATQYKLKKDIRYRQKQGDYTAVLKKLTVIAKAAETSAAVDRIWERLLEIALFVRTRQHAKPVEVLKRFIRIRKPEPPLTAEELTTLHRVFKFVRKSYAGAFPTKRIATDQTHFYTMITSLISSDLMESFSNSALIKKLHAFADLIEDGAAPPTNELLMPIIAKYLDESSEKTTDVSRREERQRLFVQAVRML